MMNTWITPSQWDEDARYDAMMDAWRDYASANDLDDEDDDAFQDWRDNDGTVW